MLIKAKQLLEEDSLTGEEVAMMEAWKKQEADFYDITAGYYQRGMKQGIQKGMQQGIQKGIQKGIEQGLHKGETLGIEKEQTHTILTLAKKKTPEEIADLLEKPLALIISVIQKQK